MLLPSAPQPPPRLAAGVLLLPFIFPHKNRRSAKSGGWNGTAEDRVRDERGGAGMTCYSIKIYVKACLLPDDSCCIWGSLEIGAGTHPPLPSPLHSDTETNRHLDDGSAALSDGSRADPTDTLGNNSSESHATRAATPNDFNKEMHAKRVRDNAFWIQSKQSDTDGVPVDHRPQHPWAMIHSPRQICQRIHCALL